jgi:hypothetical protein
MGWILARYFFQGSLVPISVYAEKTKYNAKTPILARKMIRSLFIG